MNQHPIALLKYPGSKWRVSDWIISHFPKHKVYLEPFFGSGACFFKKEPSYIETINDLDDDIVNLYRVCRESPEELKRLIELTPFARTEFISCYEKSDDPVEQARRTLVRFHQSFGTSNSSKTSWRNTQVAGGPRCATTWNYLPDAISFVFERLKNAQIECTDALSLIERYNHKDTLIYCDPPYLKGLRKSNLYRHEMSSEAHEQLFELLRASKSKIILSGYDNDLYNERLSDWNTDSVGAFAQFGKRRTEKIWYNFDNPLYYYTLI